MGIVVGIGGGEIKDRDTEAIDRRLLKLTRKDKPKALFIPTASDDAEGYWDTFKGYYESLGAEVDVLWLLSEKKRPKNLQDFILGFDAFYVGGGNTRKMLGLWAELGVDKILKEGFDKGIVCAGLSAGAMCWFEYGSSDSPAFENPGDKKLILLKALGFVAGTFSPHHIREPQRNEVLPQLLMEVPKQEAYAVDDNAAVIVRDGVVSVMSSKSGAKVRVCKIKNGEVEIKILH